MKPITIFLILTVFILNNSCGQKNSKIEFVEQGYGITNSAILKKQTLNSSPNKTLNFNELNIKLLKSTDSIPIEKGIQFAVLYQLKNKRNFLIPVDIVWEYPEGMTDGVGNKISETSYTIEKQTNINEYSNYTLENDNELVKGVWTFKMFVEKELVYKRQFYLY